ncbi:hypothetical protein MN116_003473 [Schistosoma mekongi]|uniref:Uncharacterized protein n=1 Tax=Schistosoma mekongi TaxID=38744 RepID=A0AAE2D7B6_SCHME|nr:hypothetical protein MN116_003473 [Schistosoma mekongi]
MFSHDYTELRYNREKNNYLKKVLDHHEQLKNRTKTPAPTPETTGTSTVN